MTRPAWCPLCNGVHSPCRFGLGLGCINGSLCLNPHHKGDRVAGLCRYCGGAIFTDDPRAGDAHRHCADKAKAA